mmetsp:Transcript_44386/g.71357  ORF Transcript_44386/g.71357 Transcript_44386/m.71357 type:complete len:116 (+) Transcript_44386:66-413(+)
MLSTTMRARGGDATRKIDIAFYGEVNDLKDSLRRQIMIMSIVVIMERIGQGKNGLDGDSDHCHDVAEAATITSRANADTPTTVTKEPHHNDSHLQGGEGAMYLQRNQNTGNKKCV